MKGKIHMITGAASGIDAEASEAISTLGAMTIIIGKTGGNARRLFVK